MLVLTFIPTVLVTTTQYMDISSSTILTSIGGTLGLWLGLSVLNILEPLFKWIFVSSISLARVKTSQST